MKKKKLKATMQRMKNRTLIKIKLSRIKMMRMKMKWVIAMKMKMRKYSSKTSESELRRPHLQWNHNMEYRTKCRERIDEQCVLRKMLKLIK